jgi:hypothetical protein
MDSSPTNSAGPAQPDPHVVDGSEPPTGGRREDSTSGDDSTSRELHETEAIINPFAVQETHNSGSGDEWTEDPTVWNEPPFAVGPLPHSPFQDRGDARSAPAPQRSVSFQFSIRDLLLITAGMAALLGILTALGLDVTDTLVAFAGALIGGGAALVLVSIYWAVAGGPHDND